MLGRTVAQRKAYASLQSMHCEETMRCGHATREHGRRTRAVKTGITPSAQDERQVVAPHVPLQHNEHVPLQHMIALAALLTGLS